MKKNTIYFYVIGLAGAMIVAIVSAGLVVSAQNSNSSMTMTEQPQRTGRCDPNQQEQTDLSGTYTGTVNYPDGGMTGEATLTITGNNFTLTAGASTCPQVCRQSTPEPRVGSLRNTHGPG